LRSRLLLVLLLLSAGLARAGGTPGPTVQPNIGYVSILGATPGDTYDLFHPQRGQVATGTIDAFGSLLFPFLEQGTAYTVQNAAGGPALPATVLRFEDHPAQSFYDGQTLTEGLQYITMRDGTKLAAMVRPPLGKTMADAPFPTLIEYSGYDPANPYTTTAGLPSPAQPSELIGWALGYAVVGVNMRGSGCSGGIFGIFDYQSTADGYDVVEAVAAQSWVLNHKVGMIGLSFPGITQTFVGGSQPPHLASVAPLSTIGDIYRAPGYPGGIFNNGFAQSWLAERGDDAKPAPAGGQSWARKRITDDHDPDCLANQAMRLQQLDPVLQTKVTPFYTPSLMDERSPVNWVDKIQVPTFYSASFQDEQTGPDFASMLPRFPVRPDVKITVQNGVHTSPFDPQVLWDWIAFLDIYVAGKVPDPSRFSGLLPTLTQQILGNDAPAVPVPPDTYDGVATLAAAKAQFESRPFVTVRMENGAGSDVPGIPVARFDRGFTQWPPAEATALSYYFAADGKLVRKRPHGKKADSYRPIPADPMSSLPEGNAWAVIPPYEWLPQRAGTSVAYATPPLKKTITVVGPGSVDLWLRSSAADTDLQVTLSEVRPDGLETYVQSGFLRASHRKLDDAKSTPTHPVQTHLQADAAPMPAGEFVPVRVEIYSVAHVFRKGSRVRISVEGPGGDRVAWAFETPDTNFEVLNDVGRGGKHASKLVLSVVPTSKDTPETLPPCPSLRGQPCRFYAPAVNGG